jgi:predicted polyphosphate/ATP-dependent NAD kinase
MSEPIVGVIANPASGRDIRRLVSGASVANNAEKGAMVFRLMVGLRSAGVRRVLMMDAPDGISSSLLHRLRASATTESGVQLPDVEILDGASTRTALDTVGAVEAMVDRRVAAIVVLGGDGTHRLVAKHCAGLPICALSTGTNNTFPEMREATVAGLATGLFAAGRVRADASLRREAALQLTVNGGERRDLALVDIVSSEERFVGARAVWEATGLRELFVAFSSPLAIGLSSITGLLQPTRRGSGEGVYARLGDPGSAPTTVYAPLAPGLISPVGVLEHHRIFVGDRHVMDRRPGTITLDGEREIELAGSEEVVVELIDGPWRLDVDAIMAHAGDTQILATKQRFDPLPGAPVPAQGPEALQTFKV